MIEPVELPELLTADDVAKILGRHPRTVLIMAQRGEIPCVRLGRRTLRFVPEDIQAFIDCRRAKAAAP